ncbi:unnamed protein product [Aspergillus oryzae]|uniref:Unnamed protein product n=1 Tax=Aspergillus oryzae TaxID=5062 RepID=A0AAN5BW58_ASPOZ|nr:unnamed protein product [Aspergillus oryzae]
MEPTKKYDIIIAGAGMAGINTAYRIQTILPNCSYAVLEARGAAGGTWDLFRYPGVRLDTGIHTFGFPWQPYHTSKNMLDVVVHPQFWPEKLDYAGKKIAVIGSGSTAISLVPKLAETASAVTMIQRSPSYIVSLPNGSGDSWMNRLLPVMVLHKLGRYVWMAVMLGAYNFCRTFPQSARSIVLWLTAKQLPDHVPLSPHFEPRYKVWDERLLACPDGDFFQSLHTNKVNIETANIQTVTESAVILDNGRTVDADIIVTATGLKMQVGGGTHFELDNAPCNTADKVMWKGMMQQDIPNSFFVLGHLTDASWTLGADATALFICRMIKHMEKENIRAATPRLHGSAGQPRQLWNLSSNYMLREQGNVPRAGEIPPWQPRTNYILDSLDARYGSFDTCMEFSGEYRDDVGSMTEITEEK